MLILKHLTKQLMVVTIQGKEISVAFPLYSDVHKISGAHYQTFPSEKAAYSTVYEENQRTEWIAANEDLWKVTGE
ncbi:hypothetical protein vBEcoMWL3_01065 [Escherichia phage ph0021]|nr:hypothetical protein vBEcoMWL3_01065 [Escherichia phage ph0021]